MSENKKYYYLKLKEGFCDTDEIKILESMPNGYLYSNLLLKLYLKAVKNNGAVRLNEYIPYNVDMISTITRLNIDVVRSGLKILEKMNLIETLTDGTIYMLEMQTFIGQSSSEADRKRSYRNKINEIKKNLIMNNQIVGQIADKCPTERDKYPPELELEKELEIDNKVSTKVDCSSKLQPILDKWNSLNLSKLLTIKGTRLKLLNTRIKDFGVDKVLKAIENINQSVFLKGQNDRSWTITFDWFIKPNNFTKVLEGNYIDKKFINTNKSAGKGKFNDFEQRTDAVEKYEELIAAKEAENVYLGPPDMSQYHNKK